MKAMISQPMAGKTNEEILEAKYNATKKLEELGYEVVNTWFIDEYYGDSSMTKRGVVNRPLCLLAKSLDAMSACDAVYFVDGWENARGCKLERAAAEAYGIKIL